MVQHIYNVFDCLENWKHGTIYLSFIGSGLSALVAYFIYRLGRSYEKYKDEKKIRGFAVLLLDELMILEMNLNELRKVTQSPVGHTVDIRFIEENVKDQYQYFENDIFRGNLSYIRFIIRKLNRNMQRFPMHQDEIIEAVKNMNSDFFKGLYAELNLHTREKRNIFVRIFLYIKYRIQLIYKKKPTVANLKEAVATLKKEQK